jgi:SNF2 family domain protein
MKLTTQQQNAIEKFKRLKVGALFMKQGTGKTRVSIELANYTQCELVVYIVPAALVDTLKEELNKWHLNKDYLIETYQGISRSDRRYLQLLQIVKEKTCMVIADESVFIKNDDSKTYQRMIEISKHSDYRLILNGSPITKNEWDIYNQMSFLSPKIIGMHRIDFLNNFFTHVVFKKRGQKERDFYKLSEVNIGYLHKLIEPYIFQVDLELELEEKTKTIVIGNSVYEEYSLQKKSLLDSLETGEGDIVQKLRLMEVLVFTDHERINEISKHIKGQCIVFCQFIKEIDYLASKLGKCFVIKGSIPKEKRTEIIQQFKNSNIPLLITLGTGAFGLNLQFCNKIMFSSISFNYSHIEQAVYRIKRLGQNKEIEYTYFASDLGIYNMIYENLSKKRTLQDIIINKMEGNAFEKEL